MPSEEVINHATNELADRVKNNFLSSGEISQQAGKEQHSGTLPK